MCANKCYSILCNNTCKCVLTLLFTLIEISGINVLDTHTHTFLCTHDGTKKDKTHEI